MPFCTKCGHKNADDNRFCEECGTPLKVTPPAAPATAPAPAPVQSIHQPPVSTPAPKAARNALLYGGIAAVVVVVAATAAYFALRAQEPSNALFASLIEKSVATDASAYKNRYCLSNFAYDKDPVFVGGNDSGTQQWLGILTRAGLYTEPEVETVQMGFFTEQRLKYGKTEAGRKATQGRTLCIADGVMVDKVEGFTPPAKAGALEYSTATVQFKLRNPMPWVSTEETRRAANIAMEFQDTKLLVLKDRQWALGSNDDLRAANTATQRQQRASKTANESGASGGGFFSALTKLFGSAGNPLMGRWSSNVMGMVTVQFEFDADSMTSNGQRTKVRYEVKGDTVTVYPEGSSVGEVFNVVDSNTLRVRTGLMDIELHRTN